MCSQNLTQGSVQQVGTRVVGCTSSTFLFINLSGEGSLGVRRQFLGDVNRQVVLFLGVDNLNGFVFTLNKTFITYLTTAFCIERSVGQNNLIQGLFLLFDFTIAEDTCLAGSIVISNECCLAFFQSYPVAGFHGSGVTGTFLLFLHLTVELFLVDGHVVFAKDQFCQVEWESEGIVEHECIDTADDLLAVCFGLAHGLVEHLDAIVECAEERIFFFLDHLFNQLFLCLQLRISLAHIGNQHWDEFIQERLFLSEEGICVTYGTAKDTSDDIACLCVPRKLSVSDGEGDGADMVGYYSHGDVCFAVVTIFHSRHIANRLDNRLEYIRIIV